MGHLYQPPPSRAQEMSQKTGPKEPKDKSMGGISVELSSGHDMSRQ